MEISVQQLILDDLHEIKCALEEQIKAYHVFIETYIKAHGDVDNKADRAHERLNGHDERIKALAIQVNEINKLLPFLKVLSYVLSSLSMLLIVALLSFVWAIITHQATIMIP